MKVFNVGPEVFAYQNFGDFIKDFAINEQDLILSNAYSYNLCVDLIF